MKLRPIKTEKDYQKALQQIEQLFDAKPNSAECDCLDILTTLVEAYEKQHYPIETPDAISAIYYYLEARGLSIEDLAVFLGSKEQATAILNKQKPLTLEIIRRLNEKLEIPADILIQPYSLVKTSA